VRFDELIVREPEGDLRLTFHPQLTVLAGLGDDERAAFAQSLLGALAGGAEETLLRYLDHTGGTVVVQNRDGRVAARDAAGSPVAAPIGSLATSRASLEALMVVRADDVSAEVPRSPEDEPPELREARDTLDALTAELDAARAERERTAELRAELARLDAALQAARDNAARLEYARILAQLEQMRAEAAALESDESAIEADRSLLEAADEVRQLAAAQQQAADRAAELAAQVTEEPLDVDERAGLVAVPEAPPEHLDALVDRLQAATARRGQLERRLQELAVATLPAPSDPVVAELGVLAPGPLWSAADRLVEAQEAMHEVRVSLGGLEMEDVGPAPALVADIEAAHAAVDDAERAADAVRIPAMGATVLGALAGVLGVAVAPLLVPVGLGAAIVAAVAGIVLPDHRRRRALRVEEAALERAGASSYLGFHIRRVEATVDPRLRERAETAVDEQRDAWAAWAEQVGPDLPVARALELRDEIEAYHAALQDLGETADEMDQLRRQLDHDANPEVVAARDALRSACEPYHLAEEDLDRADVAALVRERCRRGAAARAEEGLHQAEAVAQRSADRLLGRLVEVGFDDDDLAARLRAFEWEVARAGEREEARRRARPKAEVDADLARLTGLAGSLRQPDWDTVTADEAATPDVEELEARRDVVTAALGGSQMTTEVDLDRLADRQAAVARRVAALEARLGTNGDPGAIADLQQGLLARLTAASQAGPGGDPVPVVLDEVLARVPPDRSWDLLDLVLRLAERHQVIYLTDDAFVAAWARQRALDGSITLLETDSGAETPQPI
jgi:hypothetical protein